MEIYSKKECITGIFLVNLENIAEQLFNKKLGAAASNVMHVKPKQLVIYIAGM